MAVLIRNSQSQIKLAASVRKLISDCILTALKHERFDTPAEVNVLLLNNMKIQKLNKEYRDIDSSTDVLSFPMIEFKDGVYEFSDCDKDPDTGAVMLGDIAISLEKAEEQAREYGHSFEREVAFLATHGLFHLLGYDHENGSDLIFEKQEEVLKELGLGKKGQTEL